MILSIALLNVFVGSCSDPTLAPIATRDAIPLNLDFSLDGLVDEQVPWGWSFQALTWVSVEAQAQADAAQLRLHREAGAADSADGRAVYDLNRSFAGKRLNFAATIRRDDRSSASVRIGVLVLDHDWELTDGDASNRGVTAKRHPGTVRARVGAKGENTWAV